MSDTLAELIAGGSAPAEPYAQIQRDQRQHIEDLKENAARLATCSIRYVTKGVGQTTPKDAVKFDVVFTVEPSVTSGLFVSQLPDSKHYLFPQVTAGVRQWVTLENPADHKKKKDDPTRKPFYVGAYLYFVVLSQPLQLPRTDGSNLAQLNTALATANGDVHDTTGADHTAALNKQRNLQALVKEAQEAIYLKAHPARVTITHHMTFSQTAIKSLPENVTAELDGQIEGISSRYGVGQ